MLLKQANLPDPVRNLAIFLSANPTWGIYSPSWTIGGQKFWNTMTFDDPRSATGKTDVKFTKPIFFFDLNNTFRLKHSWLFEANASIQTKGDVLQRSVQDMSQDCGFFYGMQTTRSRSHRLDISIRYTFNASKSKYKGTGVGQAERQRMGSN